MTWAFAHSTYWQFAARTSIIKARQTRGLAACRKDGSTLQGSCDGIVAAAVKEVSRVCAIMLAGALYCYRNDTVSQIGLST